MGNHLFNIQQFFTIVLAAKWFAAFAKGCSVVSNVPMVASVLMIVALTFERHFAICNPHKYRIHLRTVPR